MIEPVTLGLTPDADYPVRIKRLRASIGLTQVALAGRLGVSFATVNRWENGKTEPTQLYWAQLRKLAAGQDDGAPTEPPMTAAEPVLDFTASADRIRVLAEGERLSFGHLASPAFATEISSIDPLPHQRIAVYERMLPQTRLRFLLADDAGAGKTIMAGLYFREMLARRRLRRILIVSPAGLVGNWRREMRTLFALGFTEVTGEDARNGNPFVGEASNQAIVSIDTLVSDRVFARLQETAVEPYDLVVVDEAHKLSASRGADMRVDKSRRYKLAEALAGVPTRDAHWRLPWRTHHLLLLTATPHMGKDYPYFALWRLLEPDILSTPEAFGAFPQEERQTHFIRRTKEEMVHLDGRPLYPKRDSATLAYALTQGEVSEQRLYDETTTYLQVVYNRAKILNREAAQLAMSVFQRRLASSTYALRRSLERRVQRLGDLAAQIASGELSTEQLLRAQRVLAEEAGTFDTTTADEESAQDGNEERESQEDRLMAGVIAASLADVQAEREQVVELRDLARKVEESGHESKFDKLRELVTDPQYADEKVLVFTEHRDTLEFLVRRLNGMGYTGQIAQIHGGMHYTLREVEVERFRKPVDAGGARLLICTDAAGEGINLQFCWIMVNYDVPWNPARLEQRMGRIHRYGQKHDPVIILNLVAPSTREGRVLDVLLHKLEEIRKEMHSDKVFDCIGRIFADVSIRQYMDRMLETGANAAEIADELGGQLTKEQVQAIQDREAHVYGGGGDVAKELPRVRDDLQREVYMRLLPGYTRQYLLQAAPLAQIKFEGDLGATFAMHPTQAGALDPLLAALESYPAETRKRFSLSRPAPGQDAVWLHPGEPVFEALRSHLSARLEGDGIRGTVLVDPTATAPYVFHLARVSIERRADPDFADLAKAELLEQTLVGIRQYEGAEFEPCPVEHLLLLKGTKGLPADAQRLAVRAKDEQEHARAHIQERYGRERALARKKKLQEALPEREGYLQRGFDFEEEELAKARLAHREKALKGNKKASDALEDVKQRQHRMAARREQALVVLRREPDLVAAGAVEFIVHALVVPSQSVADKEAHDKNVEVIAMQVARAYEEAEQAVVVDVHTPDRAVAAGLSAHPGFDLLSNRGHGEWRSIEVKGRSDSGEIEVLQNEWSAACNLLQRYWLYAVYDCATPTPRLVRVQDPFTKLLVKAKGSVLVGAADVRSVGEE
jgi:SNF2 family DNA or RNA helicase